MDNKTDYTENKEYERTRFYKYNKKTNRERIYR